MFIFYVNLRSNYKSAIQTLFVCRKVAFEQRDYIGTGTINPDATSEKECFMGGEPDLYLWYLNNPFKKIKN